MTSGDHGTLGEEAAKLAEAVQEWLHDHAADERGRGAEPSECQTCPACQLLRLVRSARPEVYGHLADAASSLSAALRELTRDARSSGPGPGRSTVEHIDLG